MAMKVAEFWHVKPSSLVEIYRHCGRNNCHHLQGNLHEEAADSSKMLVNFYQAT